MDFRTKPPQRMDWAEENLKESEVEWRSKFLVLSWLQNERFDSYVEGDLTTSYTLDGVFDVGSLVKAIAGELQKAREEAVAEYKQFVLNVLNGIDIADGQRNTKASSSL